VNHKKTVTDAVRAANRHNAESSTGPRTAQGKSNSCHNAFRHGILAKRVVLETHEERVAFRKLFRYCYDDFRPKGLLEKFLMEDVVDIIWKRQILEGLEFRELSRRQDLRDQLGSIFDGELDLPIDASDLPLDRGWDCERIVVRAVAGKDESCSSVSRSPAVVQNRIIKEFQGIGNASSQKGGHLEVEAVLGSALEKMTRYQSALRRDLYRAIEMLRTVQAERRKRRNEHESEIMRLTQG
jgi:hypothetical protein